MTKSAEERLVGRIRRLALLFAFLVAIALPGGYSGLAYLNMLEHVDTIAEVKAGALTALASANPDLWTFELQRMEELLRRYPLELTHDRATARDAEGNALVTVGAIPQAPVLVRSSPIYGSRRLLGQVEIAHSYRTVIYGTLVAGLLGLALGALVYLTLLVLPLRELRRTSAALAREQLAMSVTESRYRSIAETTSDAIITADGAGTIIGWNPAAARMFGYTDAEVIGQPLSLLVPHRYRDRHLGGFRRVENGGEQRPIGNTAELHGLTKSEKEILIELSLSEWDTPKGKFFAAIAHDVTERRRAEDEIKRQLEELRRWQDVMLGREERVQELKREVNALCRSQGEAERYQSEAVGPAAAPKV